ncbi:uncharacterized protein LOC141697639 [Apium graveolens]|uniref:uncharacterized protein LOC141697639 n=1 Tax=Apium graveolens TaxID=4045 RepID=UPI003D7BAE15
MATDSTNFVLRWIYIDGNILKTQLDGVIYDKPVAKHFKLNIGMKYADLCDVLFSKLKINRDKYGLKLKYRCKNPDDLKFGIIPIDDDEDVELMFGVVVSKGNPLFVELYVEKLLIGTGKNLTKNPHVGVGVTFENNFVERVGESSYSRCLEVDAIVESRASSEKSSFQSSSSSKMLVSIDDSILKSGDDVMIPMELRKGMLFKSKKELARVESGCNWMLKARKRSVHNHFEIMETSGAHTCMNTTITQDHSNLKSMDIAEAIRAQILVDPNIKEKVLLATAEDVFGYHPNRKKISNAKNLVIEDVHGSWEGSYRELPHLMEALQLFNVGTKVDWDFKENEMREVMTFKRVFWAFKPCIDVFEHCMPIILIDGTHHYGPYPGVLLSAMAVDGFSHILPLAFAIVEAENLSSWGWFMDRVRKFVAGRRHGICIISDRHAGIMAVMQRTGWCEPLDHHRFCIRHLATNFVNAHRKRGLKKDLVKLASQVQPKKFELLWNQLVLIEPRTIEWFEDKALEKWSLAHDGGKRFGIMIINHAESWNNAIIDARNLPITSLVRSLFEKVVDYFDARRVEIATQSLNGGIFTKFATMKLRRAIARASGHQVKLFDRDTWLFQVTTKKDGLKGGNNHIIRIHEYTCTCGKW